VNYETGSE